MIELNGIGRYAQSSFTHAKILRVIYLKDESPRFAEVVLDLGTLDQGDFISMKKDVLHIEDFKERRDRQGNILAAATDFFTQFEAGFLTGMNGLGFDAFIKSILIQM